MSELTSFGLIKEGWLYDTPEGPKLALSAWNESDMNVKALAFHVQALERKITALACENRALELKLHLAADKTA